MPFSRKCYHLSVFCHLALVLKNVTLHFEQLCAQWFFLLSVIIWWFFILGFLQRSFVLVGVTKVSFEAAGDPALSVVRETAEGAGCV